MMSAALTKKDLWDATWASFKAARKIAELRTQVVNVHATYEEAKKALQDAQTDHMKAALRLREVEEMLVQQCADEQEPQQQEIAA